MKFSAIFAFAVGTPILLTDAASNNINKAEQIRIQNYINNVRTGVMGSGMHPPSINSRYVTYNASVQNLMDNWFSSQVQGQKDGGLTNGDRCWVPGDICRSMMDDSKFKDLTNEGWLWYLFDSTNNRPTATSGIFQFRAKRQLPCFNYSACDPNPNNWSNYASCYNVNVSKKIRCNNFNNYLPSLLDPTLSQISCKLTGKPGPFNVKNQPNSFYCIALLLDNNGKPATNDEDFSDQPYVAADAKHQPCSKCPKDATQCYHNLCVAKPPAVLTFSAQTRGSSTNKTEYEMEPPTRLRFIR